jgi:MscS family membrane protein
LSPLAAPGILASRMFTPWLDALTADPTLQAVIVLFASWILAFLTELLFRSVLTIFAQNTKTQLDDIIVAAVRRPLFLSVIFLGISTATSLLEPRSRIDYVVNSALLTMAILLWTGALFRISTAVLRHWSLGARPGTVLQPRTIPLFDMLAKVVVFGAAIYLALLAWGLDVTGWLASAGIVGIAVGFAAKDSLANLFAGIFIIADAPFKIGDFIMFEDGMRGRVTDIGLRATRILTRDDIEINIPNQIIGNSRVVNETGGPHEKERVKVTVSAAYGADIDVVRQVLLECPKGLRNICEEPRPHTIFLAFGASGLDFALCVWIHNPALKEDVIDTLNDRIYKAFAAANLEIPYSKFDVYVKTLPTEQEESTDQPETSPQPAVAVSPQTAAASVAHILAQSNPYKLPTIAAAPRHLPSGPPG